MTILDDFYDLAEYHFIERQTSILDRLALLCGLPQYVPPEPQRYRIYDHDDLPIICHICKQNNWTWEDEEWACDHNRDEEYLMVPSSVRDEKKPEDVSRWEKIK